MKITVGQALLILLAKYRNNAEKYNELKHFIPWDGTINPFVVKSPAIHLHLFSSKNGAQKNEVSKPSFCITM